GGGAAELAMRRGQLEAAAEFDRAEPHLVGHAGAERVDGFGRDLDAGGLIGREPLRAGWKRNEDERERDECCARRRPPQCSLRAGIRAGSGGASSSNSSASLSVIAPPSSSASTMVTARR